jgi:hypothetical protein
MLLCGCSAVVHPPQGRGRVADPVTSNGRLHCLLSHHLPARRVGSTGIQIGPLPAGPTVQFQPSNGAAETRQVDGKAQGAEVIGNALVYPNRGSDAELSRIEDCVKQGMN